TSVSRDWSSDVCSSDLDHLYDGPAGAVPESFQVLGYSRIGPVPVSALLWAGVAVAAWFLLSRTRLGYRIYAVGGNEEVARLSGVDRKSVVEAGGGRPRV